MTVQKAWKLLTAAECSKYSYQLVKYVLEYLGDSVNESTFTASLFDGWILYKNLYNDTFVLYHKDDIANNPILVKVLRDNRYKRV